MKVSGETVYALLLLFKGEVSHAGLGLSECLPLPTYQSLEGNLVCETATIRNMYALQGTIMKIQYFNIQNDDDSHFS